MHLSRALVALVVVAAGLAGCVQVADDPQAQAGVAPATLLPDLSDLQEPAIDTERARLWWESFVTTHKYRHAGTPANIAASEQLEAELAEAGYEARTFYYVPPQVRGVPIPVSGESPVEQGIRAVVGVKKGHTMPEHVVAWVAHYDGHQATIEAAYDDGSGTAVALELARALASYNNSKTLMPIFFDAEEVGLAASDAFVRQAMESQEYTFDLVIGHDMTGINCPGHEWPMYQFAGENFADLLVPIEQELYTHLGIDWGFGEDAKNCVVILDVADRNSDERRFKEAGVPVIRMAGGRKAVDYPEYHKPGDTVEYVYGFVGGPENYEKGIGLVIRASWWNAVVFDRLPPLAG